MDVTEYMEKNGLTEGSLDELAAVYESGEYAHADAPVYGGSHLDVVGKKRVTVVYDAADVQHVARIAKNRGVRPSEIYRDALGYYLAAQA